MNIWIKIYVPSSEKEMFIHVFCLNKGFHAYTGAKLGE